MGERSTVHTGPRVTGTAEKRTRLKRPERRAAIIDGAAAAFAKGGYAATSMAEVAFAAGVSHLIVYRHFDSKEALYNSVLARAVDHLSDALCGDGAVGRLGPTPATVLHAARADHDAFVILWRHAGREPEFTHWNERSRKMLLDTTAVALRPHVARADLRWATRATVAYLVEAVLVWIEDGDPRFDERFVVATNAALRAGVTSWTKVLP